MNPVETYLRELASSAARVLLSRDFLLRSARQPVQRIGKTLKPKIRCVINLQDHGAGIPDGGLFTPTNFKKPRC